MNTYVISDIHGCFDEFQRLLDKINFSGSDRLILAGDYIDRGSKSLEMLRWLERRPENVLAVRGNHDEEFAGCIGLMRQTDRGEDLQTEPDSNADAAALYETTKYVLRRRSPGEARYFDLYGTIGKLLGEPEVNLSVLSGWADMIRQMPFFLRFPVGSRTCVVVHAGYREKGFTNEREASEFYLYAREEGVDSGGIPHGIIVAGHTPTVVKGTFAYTGGTVFRSYDPERDCVFYDIDCGCVLRRKYPQARLACLRLEDQTVNYV